MSIRISLTDDEHQFFVEYTEQQQRNAASDPGRGVLTRAALTRLQNKLTLVAPDHVDTLNVANPPEDREG